MTKRRKQQRKRQQSRAKQADMYDNERYKKAQADYQGSQQESFDSTNERIRGTGRDASDPIGRL
jgi:hypothetical protein